MQNIRKKIPGYIWVPLIGMLAMNCAAYFGTRPFTQGMYHYKMILAVDNMLPLVPFFAFFYILAYVQWIVGYILISLDSKKLCYEMMMGEILAKIICMICFIVIPTTLVRPEIQGNGIWERLVALIYQMDAADNLFPSIHCLESWFCFRGALKMKKTPRWYPWLMLVISLGVFASTVLIKQHVVVDIAGAVAAAEIGIYLNNKIRVWRIFDRITARILYLRTGQD